MKAALLPIAIFASAAAAQSSSACAAQYIVDTCLTTENAKLSSCATNDYDCECASYQDILTCYNNCPNDPQVNSVQGQIQIFCGYASQFPSSTTVATPGPKSTSASAGPTTTIGGSSGAQTTAAAASSPGSSTASAASPTKTNNAAGLAFNAGGFLAAVAGAVAALL